MPQTVISEQLIKVIPSRIYRALTHAAELTEWLCDFATVAPRPGGRLYLWWHGDFFSAGEYIDLVENQMIQFKWFGRFDPAASEVKVSLQGQEDGTLVTIAHTVPDSDGWDVRTREFKEQWDTSLINLAQVMETGLDKRAYDRPMLGINISDFNPEIARNMGVPVENGIRLDEVREGMGAYAAGLRKDDVLIEMNGHPLSNDFGSFLAALRGKKGGDRVLVTYFRGKQKKSVEMELSKRPIPNIPWDVTILASQVEEKYKDSLGKLSVCFDGVTEQESTCEPSPGEWSAQQVLAHLIHTERAWIANVEDTVGGYPRLADDWGGNQPAHIQATIKAYGSTQEMLLEMNHLALELTGFLSALPEVFLEHKSAYLQVAAQSLELQSHTLSHIEQIQAAIATARKQGS